MVGCGIRRPELALVIHAKATPPPPPPPSIPPSPVCRGFTWIIPLPPALGGNSIDGPPSHHIFHFTFYCPAAFSSDRRKKKQMLTMWEKNNNIRWSVLPGGLHFKGLYHVFETALFETYSALHRCNPTPAPPSVRRGQHLHPAYPFMCHPLSAACAVGSCEQSIQRD